MSIIKILVDLSSKSIGMVRIFKKAIQMQTGSKDSKRFFSGSARLSRTKFTTPIESSPLNPLRHSIDQSRSFTTTSLLQEFSDHGEKLKNQETSSLGSSDAESSVDSPTERPATPLRASRVPSSRLGRLFHYGGLAAGIGWGTASEALRRTTSVGLNDSHPLALSEANVRRLVDKLTKMRGAALKLGQFMAIQDAKILPPQIEEIFLKVQCTADYMPFEQTKQVLTEALGTRWSEKLMNFGEIPIAAASIGQVHAATITQSERSPVKAAVKVQFPGVHESIQSDLSYLGILAATSSILPKGLFLNKSIEVLGQELKDECDYVREAQYGKKMGYFLKQDRRFRVPRVFDNLSTKMVLTTEFMSGTSLRHAAKWSQDLRDKIGHHVLELCFREILHFRLMQTDPNWSNFLWNETNQQIELIDFGATREYEEKFIDDYIKLLKAGINGNRNDCIEASINLGYLTGNECETMLDSQFKTIQALGEPFRATSQQPYDFSTQTVTDRVRAEIPTIIRLRLTPPPIETYSLHRKLSGIFLLCNRLGSRIHCHQILENLLSQKESRSWESNHILCSESI